MQQHAGKPKRPPQRRQKPPKRTANPISAAILSWASSIPASCIERTGQSPHGLGQALVDEAPKRWAVYEPMALLPSNSFTGRLWQALLGELDAPLVDTLWAAILGGISQTARAPLTHLAVNEGIPPQNAGAARAAGSRRTAGARAESQRSGAPPDDGANILRRPLGLRMLRGDFGPAGTPGADDGDAADAAAAGGRGFDEAFWVSTKQNGIRQVWAPRWTMFSRGNVKEKARLLAFHDEPPAAAAGRNGAGPARRARPRAALAGKWAVDLYAGIGYFVFSYAKLGLGVLCWELNPWSVEGLRRGAEANGWSVRVVSGPDLALPTTELVSGRDQITVFLEDNREARRRVEELRTASALGMHVMHVNCGLLPASTPTWRPALAIIGPHGNGWLHLHENVGAADIQARRQEIQEVFNGWASLAESSTAVSVEHVEQVKTFAPDVWHCVFDVHVSSLDRNDVT